jgi:hypothetical protein
VVEIFAFLELEQKLSFFKGLTLLQELNVHMVSSFNPGFKNGK